MLKYIKNFIILITLPIIAIILLLWVLFDNYLETILNNSDFFEED